MDPTLNWAVASRAFFANYSSFHVNQVSIPIDQFSRLAYDRGWTPGDLLWNTAWQFCFSRPYQGQHPLPHGGNDFFEQQHRQNGFVPDNTNEFAKEFGRLASRMKWKRGSAEFQENRIRAYEAEARGFLPNSMSTLEQWQQLCRETLLEDIPPNISGCKKALRMRFVNLVDLMDSRRTGSAVEVFDSQGALSDYTYGPKKYKRCFPLQAAKENSVIKSLLQDFR